MKAILYVQFCCFSTVCLLLSRVNHRYQILIIELKLSLKIALRQNLRVTSRAGMAHSVRVYILLHTPSEFQPHQCLLVCVQVNGSKKTRLPCWPSRGQQVSHQRWPWGSDCMQVRKHVSKGSMLAMKPKADVTRSPKQGYRWPDKNDWCAPKKFKEKNYELEAVIVSTSVVATQ